MPTKARPADQVLAELPAAVLAHFRCPECGCGLYRAETGWVCPVGLRHTGIISDTLLGQRVAAAIAGGPKRPPKGTTRRRWQARWWANPARVVRVLKPLSRRRLIPRANGGGRRPGRVKGV